MPEFTRLLEQEIPGLWRYARVLAQDTAAADDLVQSCLAQALAKAHLWQPGSDLRAWLFAILHNLHIDEIRRARREQNGVAAASASLGIAPPDPDACLDLLDLERAIARLPERHRRVVLLIGLEGMRCEQAAAILGISASTARSRLWRARERLRKATATEW
jgi:RNA polymerase sigma-70 factor (ECF subfamily)